MWKCWKQSSPLVVSLWPKRFEVLLNWRTLTKKVWINELKNQYLLHIRTIDCLADLLIKWLVIDWLTDWVADWLTNWLTDRLIDWLTDRLNSNRLTYCLTYWLSDRLTDWFTDLPTELLTDWLTDRLTDWLTDWLTCLLTEWQTNWPTDSLTFQALALLQIHYTLTKGHLTHFGFPISAIITLASHTLGFPRFLSPV